MADASLNHLERVQKQWTVLGESDPLWAILSIPGTRGGKWDQTAFFKTGSIEIDDVIGTAANFYPIRFGTAVDFGCGVGRLSQALAKYFERVVGIDVSKSMIAGANRLNHFQGRCEYVHNAAPDLGFMEDDSVDFVYSSITLQHVKPDLGSQYIQEFFRIARPGAHVVFQLPSGPRSQTWHRLKSALPVQLTNWLRRLRSGSPAAMESYFTPEKCVRAIVEKSRGSIALMEPDRSGPPGWDSRRYFCTKS